MFIKALMQVRGQVSLQPHVDYGKRLTGKANKHKRSGVQNEEKLSFLGLTFRPAAAAPPGSCRSLDSLFRRLREK